MKWLKLDKKYMFMYFILSLLSLLYIFPIILINADYKDDLGISISGVTGLRGDGRPLGDYLVSFLCGGAPFTHIAPLPLIISVLFLSYALVLYAKEKLHFVTNNYVLIPVLLAIITNPLAVECLSYRAAGSIVMMIALALPFMMYAIPDTVPNLYVFVYSAVLCMAVMSLYQASIGLCLVLLGVNIFFAVVGEKKLNYLREGIRLAGIGVSAIFYKVIVANHYVERSDWRYEASQTVALKLSSVTVIIQNIIDSCRYLKTFFAATPIWYRLALAVTILSAIAVMLILYCRENDSKGWRKAAGIAFLGISPVIIFLVTFLPMMLLKSLMLKTRLFLALGGVFSMWEYFCFIIMQKRREPFSFCF